MACASCIQINKKTISSSSTSTQGRPQHSHRKIALEHNNLRRLVDLQLLIAFQSGWFNFRSKSPRWDLNAFGHQNHKVPLDNVSAEPTNETKATGFFCRYANDLYANDHVQWQVKSRSSAATSSTDDVYLSISSSNSRTLTLILRIFLSPKNVHCTTPTKGQKMSKLFTKCSRLETTKRPDNRFPASYLPPAHAQRHIPNPKKSLVPAKGLLFAESGPPHCCQNFAIATWNFFRFYSSVLDAWGRFFKQLLGSVGGAVAAWPRVLGSILLSRFFSSETTIWKLPC